MQQQINHVSHVSFVFRRENIPTAMQRFSDAFGITDWDGPKEIAHFGILQAQSVSTGIEVLAPLRDDDGNPFTEHLRTRGEGFYALIYGVADLEKAAQRAQAKGVELVLGEDGKPFVIDALHIDNGRPAHASWSSKLKAYREIQLKPMYGANFFFSQIEPLQK